MAADDLNPPARDEAIAAESVLQQRFLLDRVCDQLASSAEIAELDALLTADRSLRETYLQYISLHTSMQNGAGNLSRCAAGACVEGAIGADLPSRGSPRRPFLGLAIAAGLAAVLVGSAIYRGGPASTPRPASSDVADDGGAFPHMTPVARVTHLSHSVAWRNPNESIALFSHVRPGQLFQIERGELLLTYDTGVELRLLAPAEFTVAGDGGSLRRGGLRAVVPEAGRGFTIMTPNGKIVDLGTEFGVAVDDFGLSEVNVYQGMVDMLPLQGGADADTIRLNQGEAVQWNGETVIRLKADPLRFGFREAAYAERAPANRGLVIDEEFEGGELDRAHWRTLGDVRTLHTSLALRGPGQSGDRPYIITTRQFAPVHGPVTVVCDIRFTSYDVGRGASFAVLTRSSDEHDAGAPEDRRTMHTCMRCSFKSVDASSTGIVEAATKLDRDCPLTNIQWRGFDQLEPDVPYRLVMTDDGINVRFSVSLRDDPSIRKSVTCRSLFRGKENFIVLEGPQTGTVAVDRIQVFQNAAAKRSSPDGSLIAAGAPLPAATKESIERVLAALAPPRAELIVRDDFEKDALDESTWTALDDVAVIDGRVRLGKPNAEEHINTFTSRPYLLTRETYAVADGVLTIMGTIKFETNFLHEYGGSFAVMTRADNQRGNGPGWEYSILRTGVRANFWPAAWGQQHSLEIHEKPSPTSLALLVAEGLEINPDARQYCFKVVDDGETAALTIQDVQDSSIAKTISVKTSKALDRGFVGFESCWGCPVWLDNVRIYRSRPRP